MRLIRFSLLALLVTFAAHAAAQPPDRQRRPDLQDPTVPSDRLREMIGPGPKAVAPTGPMKFPIVTLKGRVLAKGKPPAALVEIDKVVYSITQGSTVNVGGTQILKFVEVTAEQIRFEVNGSKESLFVD